MELSLEDKKGIYSNDRVKAGASIYTKSFLYIYDWLALGYNLRFIWECPSRHMLDMYDKYVSANHLDIGVGTGYFLNNCKFPSDNPRIALMDLNTNALETASKRIVRYNPEVFKRNVLEPFDINVIPFDSIAMMNLLHCLPGDMNTKGMVFENAKEVLNNGGVLFGSTILHKGVKRNILATMMLKMDNRIGIMSNIEDDVEVLRENLNKYFSESNVQIIGCEALFWARK